MCLFLEIDMATNKRQCYRTGPIFEIMVIKRYLFQMYHFRKFLVNLMYVDLCRLYICDVVKGFAPIYINYLVSASIHIQRT